jgi:hypothetical protein
MLHRLRITAALLVVAALAFFVIPRVQAQPVSTPMLVVHQAPSHIPLAPRTVPINLIALGAIAGATAVKRSRSNPNMIVDSIIHVARKDDKGNPTTLVINPGVLADDTELTDDEIDENIARGAVRFANPAELHRLEQIAVQRETAKIARDAERTTATMNATADAERQRIIAETDAEKSRRLAELDERLDKERQDAASKTAEETKRVSATSASSSAKKAAAPVTRTSNAGAASTSTPAATPPNPAATIDARTQAMGGTSTPNTSTSPDVGAEAARPVPVPTPPSTPTPPTTK